jgi:hypothetical protein
MRPRKLLLLVALALLVAGFLVARDGASGSTTFAYVGEAVPQSFFMVTNRMAAGYCLIWLGTLVLAGLAGDRLARR